MFRRSGEVDQQRVIFTGKRPEVCNVSSDYSIQPAVIEVLTANLIELGLVLEERQPSKSTETSPTNACRLFCHRQRQEGASVRFITSSSALVVVHGSRFECRH